MELSPYTLKLLNVAITEHRNSTHSAKRYLVIVINMLANFRMISLMDMEFLFHLRRWNGFMENLLKARWLKSLIQIISDTLKTILTCGKELFWTYTAKSIGKDILTLISIFQINSTSTICSKNLGELKPLKLIQIINKHWKKINLGWIAFRSSFKKDIQAAPINPTLIWNLISIILLNLTNKANIFPNYLNKLLRNIQILLIYMLASIKA